MSPAAKDVDAYLASVPEEARVALERLRAQIRVAAPSAVEAISYQMPAFKLRGRRLVAFAAFKDHCSLFPGSSVMEAHKDELKGYDISKGTIRFAPGKPLPAALVKKLIRARVAENETKRTQVKERKEKERTR